MLFQRPAETAASLCGIVAAMVLVKLARNRHARTPKANQPAWDAVNGVWAGDRAASSNCEIPDPLWIFGYGSLCWKPEFPHKEVVVGTVHGWKRFFAQKSTDHRGTPDAPGLVATLLTDEQLTRLGLRKAGDAPSSTCGVCYLVGAKDATQVLETLDFREKGGYTREIVKFQPRDTSRPAVRALLYSATPDNPGFTKDPILDPDSCAYTIGTATGPSGPNRDYLLNLASWLEKVGEEDEHIKQLLSKLPPDASR